MTDKQGRPTVSTYYDTEGMTAEDVEAMDEKILAVAGHWGSPQFGIDTKRRFTWSCGSLAEASALRERLEHAEFPAIECITGSRTR
jgi:hypothetical protein